MRNARIVKKLKEFSQAIKSFESTKNPMEFKDFFANVNDLRKLEDYPEVLLCIVQHAENLIDAGTSELDNQSSWSNFYNTQANANSSKFVILVESGVIDEDTTEVVYLIKFIGDKAVERKNPNVRGEECTIRVVLDLEATNLNFAAALEVMQSRTKNVFITVPMHGPISFAAESAVFGTNYYSKDSMSARFLERFKNRSKN